MQGRIDRVKAGDPITDTLFNAVIDRLTPLANLTSGSPYLLLDDHPYCGKHLHLAVPSKTSARLTSDTSPYSWEEVDEVSGGTWAAHAGSNGGTNNAYEINNVAGLSGNVYWLTSTGAGDYRFQAIRMGCSADANHFCMCGCPTPFPKTFYTGDGLGTHTLTLSTFGGTAAQWTGTAVAPGIPTWRAAPGTGVCSTETVLDLTVVYTLIHNCPGPSFPLGRWLLSVNYTVQLCYGCFPDCPAVQRYGDPAHGGASMGTPPQDSITGACDFSLLAFNIPTAATFGGIPLAGTPTLGGGGLMTVTP